MGSAVFADVMEFTVAVGRECGWREVCRWWSGVAEIGGREEENKISEGGARSEGGSPSTPCPPPSEGEGEEARIVGQASIVGQAQGGGIVEQFARDSGAGDRGALFPGEWWCILLHRSMLASCVPALGVKWISSARTLEVDEVILREWERHGDGAVSKRDSRDRCVPGSPSWRKQSTNKQR